MRIAIALPAVLLLWAQPSAGHAGETSAPKKDLVVLGRVENLRWDTLDEYGMQGRITARLHVTRVIRGRAASDLLPIRYIAHSYLADDRDVRLRLRRGDDGVYFVCGEGSRGYVCR